MMSASSSSSCCPCATVNGANSASRPTTTAVQPSSSSPSSPRRGGDAAAAAAEGAHPQARRGRRRQQRPRQQQGLVLLGLPVLVLLSLLLVLLLAGAPRAGAIQLDVDPYTTRCIMDEYAPEEESALRLRAVGRVQEGVRATVSNPEERAVWDGYLTAAEQEVPLPEDDYGLYRICVHNGAAAVQRVEVGTLERAVKLSNKDAKLTKEHLRPLQLLFRRAELTVLGVSKELDNVRQREAALRETSETTDSRIQWFSIFSIVILLAVATWQVVFLKQFFRSKKLL